MLLDGVKHHKSDTAQIVFDPNIRPHLWSDHVQMRSLITKAAGIADIVMPSFDDETKTFGDSDPMVTAQRYADLGCDHVVVKDGSNETVLLHNGKTERYSVAPIDDVLDTTAAGDSFNGCYVAALLNGVPAVKAIKLAQGCAGRVIQNKGALIPFSKLAIKD